MNIKWLDLVKLLAPLIIASVVPNGAVLGPLVAQGISEAESIKDASGADKKAHVMDLVNTSVASVNAATGTNTLDPKVTAAAVSSAIDTTVAVVNLVNANKPDPKPTPVG